MSTEFQLREKLRKIEALFAGAGTTGERLAAEAAVERLRERLANLVGKIPYGQKIETAQRRQRSNIFGLGPVLHNKLAVDA